MNKSLSITAAAVVALVGIGALSGCADSTPAKVTDPPVTSTEKPKTEEPQESSDSTKLTKDEIDLANSILENTAKDGKYSPATSGEYVTVEGSDIFKGMTKLVREDGKELFFATSDDAAFGSNNVGMVIPANEETRSVTVIGEKVGPETSGGAEASKVLDEVKDKFK